MWSCRVRYRKLCTSRTYTWCQTAWAVFIPEKNRLVNCSIFFIVSFFKLLWSVQYYCFTWQSIISLYEALFRLFILDIPSGKAKKVLWFRSCSCSFDASKRLVCPIGHNGFPLIVMMNLRRFLEVRRKSCSFLNFLAVIMVEHKMNTFARS